MSTQANPTASSPRSSRQDCSALCRTSVLLAPSLAPSPWSLSGFCGANIMVLLHDARIYMGRGLADLDPHGVGADLLLSARRPIFVQRLFEDRRRSDPGVRSRAFGAFVERHRLLLWLAAMAALAATARERAAEVGDFDLRRHVERRLWRASAALRRGLRDAASVRRGRRAGGARGAARGNAFDSRCSSWLLAALFHPIMALAGAGVCLLTICVRRSPLDLSWPIWRGRLSLSRRCWGCRCFRASWSASTGTGLSSCDCALLSVSATWQEPAWTTLVVHVDRRWPSPRQLATATIKRLFWSVIVSSLGWLLLTWFLAIFIRSC